MTTNIKVLDDEVVEQIISEGIALLWDPGIRIQNQEGLQLFAEAGALVNFETDVAKISEELVRRSLETVPKTFHLYPVSGDEPIVQYGGDAIHFDPGSAGIMLLDDLEGNQRNPITADYVKWVKLVEVLPQLDAQSTSMVSSDVTEEIGDLYRLYLSLNYMNKPIVTGAFRKDTWWTMKDLLVAVRGSEEALREKPLAIFDVCPSPPLTWSDLTCQNLIDCARAGIPSEMVSMPLAGATAPVTIAASIVQHTAESMSGIVLSQIVAPGAPIVWGGSPSAFDMRMGTTPMGAAETWLIDAGYVQVGKALGMPTHVYMGMSDAKVVDVQCGLESMGGALAAVMIGANMISGAGMMDFENCLSFEKLILDAEIIALARRFRRGIELRDDPIGEDLIREMGHHADYLSSKHTRKWYRKELSFPPELIDRGSWDAWKEGGSTTATQRAQRKMQSLLDQYQPNALSKEQHDDLREIALKAAVQFGMDSLPVLED
jgi:trimethylamine---corrinoid protein Co-methyltransferase